jgi:uncharacterized protein (TIGR02001 family)
MKYHLTVEGFMHVKTLSSIAFSSLMLLNSQVRAAGDLDLAVRSSFLSRYVWRGVSVEGKPVFQQSVNLSGRGLSLDLWGNFDLSRSDGMNELDVTVGYVRAVESFNLECGLVYYTFPNTSAGVTTEIYLGVTNSSVLNPWFRVYRDIRLADCAYCGLGIAPCFSCPGAKELTFGIGLGFGSSGFNRFCYGVDKAAFSDLQINVSLPLVLAGRCRLTPSAGFSALLDSGIRKAMAADDCFVAGLTLSLPF